MDYDFDGKPSAPVPLADVDFFGMLIQDGPAKPDRLDFPDYSQGTQNTPMDAEVLDRTAYRAQSGHTGSSILMPERQEDSDLLFTPLLSPALTPMTSIFSGSSGMPSTYKPVDDAASALAASHLNPGELFSPLSSPAITPQHPAVATSQGYGMPLQDQADGMPRFDQSSQEHDRQVAAFLEGQRQVLQAMGFGHLLSQPQEVQNKMAQMLRNEAPPMESVGSSGESTSSQQLEQRPMQGGRGRGASRTNARSRPSPIIKPSNGPPRSRRTSISHSAYNSPAFPPSVYSSIGPQPLSLGNSLEESPSPIELGSMQDPPQQPVLPAMGPPSQIPITPASLMNLSTDFDLFAGLSPSLQPTVPVPDSAEVQPTEQETSTNQNQRKAKPPAKSAKTRATRKAKGTKLAEPTYDDAPEEDNRKMSHKNAEQRRRDSLKACFEELRQILPYIPPEEDEDAPRRPGEGNVGGQRSGIVDPHNPNKGVSKVALLRKSNVYIAKLHERVSRRDHAIHALRSRLAALGVVAELDAGLNALALDDLDAVEEGSWPSERRLEEELAQLPSVEEQAMARRNGAGKRSKRKSGAEA